MASKNHKKFLRNTTLILKTQQIFKNQRHNVFTEDINKIAWGWNDDKIMQSLDSTETYAYGTRKDLAKEKKEIKCKNTIKWYKNWLTLTMLQKKTKK